MPENPKPISSSKMNTLESLPAVLVAAVLGLVLFLLALAGYAVVSEANVPTEPEPPFIEGPPREEPEGVACTLDAKICPDGSAVGRVAPDCEFALCPGE